MREVERLIEETCDLPTIPTVAMKVMELVSMETTSALDLQVVIENDAGLAGRVLKISNSALYGCRSSITNLSQAIMVMGFSILKAVVIAASTRNIYKRFGLTEKFLWEHSIVNGLASRQIALKVGFGKVEEAFLAGLMHDIGKVVICNSFPAQYQQLVNRVYLEGLDFAETETAAFGYNHLDVGWLLARKWKLPDEMAAAIRYHHDFTVEPDPLYAHFAAIVNLANSVSRFLGVGGEFHAGVNFEEMDSFKYLGLKPEDMLKLVEKTQEEYQSEKQVLC
ncbi:MAG TPA: HDOD domain-containing protein [Nitrospirota bacterium]|jgi:putative nucleotidyltransferase with HDIG domain